jgi:hypothetical protein
LSKWLVKGNTSDIWSESSRENEYLREIQVVDFVLVDKGGEIRVSSQ